MSVNVRDGYLFRTTDRKGAVSDKPFVGSAIANRLISHPKTALGIHEAESIHSFRSGCYIAMSMVCVPLEDVARHVGWRSLDTADYYTQTERVINMSRVASALADSTHTAGGSISAAVQQLKHFILKTVCAVSLLPSCNECPFLRLLLSTLLSTLNQKSMF